MVELKRFVGLGMFFLVVLVFASFANAFGIAVSYWEPDNQLKVEPGDSVDVSFRLQNGEGEDMILRAELVEGAEIATITDESTEYFVPVGSEGVRTNIRVSIPEGTLLGTEYRVAVGYTQVAEDEGEMVQVAARIVQSIPVIVGGETVIVDEPQLAPEEGISTGVWIILGVLVVIVIWYLLKGKKKKKKKR